MPILIVGLSTRAIAQSAIRGGYDVITVDAFGDRDQRALVPNYALQRDLHVPFSARALLEASIGLGCDSVAYTSSLENHPDVVTELARDRKLLGNSPGVLAQVRDWATLRAVCDEEGMPCATTLLPGEESKADPTRPWLVKPVRSGGGRGIRPWRGEPLDADHVLQNRVDGRPASAAFVADGKRSVLLSLTEQLIGREELGGRGFTWCGNILPLTLRAGRDADVALRSAVRTAARLTRRFGLRGLNGLDLIVADDEDSEPVPYLVEVNPRYTASMELVDWAYGLSAFHLHVRSFDRELPVCSLAEPIKGDGFRGKAVVYAMQDVAMPNTAVWQRLGRRDIPFSGDKIAAGHPICTVMAEGKSRTACWRKLVDEAERVRESLIPLPPSADRKRWQ